MRNLVRILSALGVLTSVVILLSCDRQENVVGESGTIRLTPRVVRSASVSEALWNSTSSVAVSIVDSTGKSYADDTVEFKAHQIAGVAVPNDRSLTVTIKGMDAASTTLWSGIATLPATAHDTDFRMTVGSAAAVSDTSTTLQLLSVGSGALSPSFFQDTLSYVDSVSATTTSLSVTATVSSASDTIRIGGAVAKSGVATSVDVGTDTTISVVVKSPNTKRTHTYSIHVLHKATYLGNFSIESGIVAPSYSIQRTSYQDTVASNLTSLVVTLTGKDTFHVNGVKKMAGADTLDVHRDTSFIVQDSNAVGVVRDTVHVFHRIPTLTGISVDGGMLSPNYLAGVSSYVATAASNQTSLSVMASGLDSLYVDGKPVASGASVSVGAASDRILVVLDSNVYTGKSSRDTIHVVHRVPKILGLSVDSGTFYPTFDTSRTSYGDTVSSNLSSLRVTAKGSDSLFVNGIRATSGAVVTVDAHKDTFIVATDSNLATGKSWHDTIHVVHRFPKLSGLSVDSGVVSAVFDTAKTSYGDTVSSNLSSLRVRPKGLDSLYVNGIWTASDSARTVSVLRDTIVVVTDSNVYTGKSWHDTIHVVHRGPKILGLSVDSGSLSPVFDTTKTGYWDTVSSNLTSLNVTAKGLDSLFINGVRATSGTAATVDARKDTFIVVTDSSKSLGKSWRDTIHVVHRVPKILGLSVDTGTFYPAFDTAKSGYVDMIPQSVTKIKVKATVSDSLWIQGIGISTGAWDTVSISKDTTRIVVLDSNVHTGKSSRDTVLVIWQIPLLSKLVVDSGTLVPAFDSLQTEYWDTVSWNLSALKVTATGSGSLYLNGTTAMVSGSPTPVNVSQDTSLVILDTNGAMKASSRYTVHVVHRSPMLSGLSVDKGSLIPYFSSTTTNYVDTVASDLATLNVTPNGMGVLTVNGYPLTLGNSATVNVQSDTTILVVDSSAATGKATRYFIRVVHKVPVLSSLSVDSGTLTPYFSTARTSYRDTVSADFTTLKVIATASDALYLNGDAIASGVAAGVDVGSDKDIVVLDTNLSTGKSSRDTIHVVHKAPLLTGLAAGSGSLVPTTFLTTRTSYRDTVASNLAMFHLTAIGPDSIYANGKKIGSGVVDSVYMPWDSIVVVVDSSLNTKHASHDTIRVVHRTPVLTGLSAGSGSLVPSTFLPTTTSYRDTVASNLAMFHLTATGLDSIYANGKKIGSGVVDSVYMPWDSIVVVVDSNLVTKRASRDTIYVYHKVPTLMGVSVDSGSLLPSFSTSVSSYIVDTVSRTDSVLHVTVRGVDSLYLNGIRVDSGMAKGVSLSGDTTKFVVLDSNVYTKRSMRDTFYVVRGGMFTDSRDAVSYPWVKIGTQVWMAKNLNHVVDSSWCYANSTDSCAKYGRLYQWSSAMGLASTYDTTSWGGTLPHQGACPSGWHVPSDAEWSTLVQSVGSATSVAKLTSTSGWSNTGADVYGFRVLPAGLRNHGGTSLYVGESAYFWSSSEYAASYVWWRGFIDGLASVYREYGYYGKSYGLSLRCVEN